MTRPSRRAVGIGAIVVLALAAIVLWLASSTEWQDLEIPRAPSGRAALDEHYALERLAEGLGTRVVNLERLENLPPPAATLLLGSWSWDTFPERDRALRAWVQQGGNLVLAYWEVPAASGKDAEGGGAQPETERHDWIPVQQIPLKPKGGKGPGASKTPVPGRPPARGIEGPIVARKKGREPMRLIPAPPCHDVREAEGMAPAYGDAQGDAQGDARGNAPGNARFDAPAFPPAAVPGPGVSAAPPTGAPAMPGALHAVADGAAGANGDAKAPLDDPDEDNSDDDSEAAAAAARAAADADGLAQTGLPTPAVPTGGLRLCSYGLTNSGLATPDPRWGLRDAGGFRVVRIAVGAGTVTVVEDARIFANDTLLFGDNGLIDVAALQLRAGRELWIAAGDGRQPVLAWLWTQAPAVPLAGALLLVLWLWRSLPRFGPREELPGTARRSMVEQISGTARFLWQRSPAALHGAQRRALDEAAARRIRNYARLDLSDRAAAIARATGFEASALLQALAIDRAPDRRSLPRQLAVLEAARRALLREAPDRAAPLPDSKPSPWSKTT